jgi:hypothetical protein
VAVRRCIQNVCDSPQYYAGPLERGALAIDGSKAVGRLRTRIGGLDVAADWTPLPPGTVVLGGTHGGGTDGDLAVETYRADPAAVRLVLGVGHCTGAGEVGDEARLELPEGSSGATVPLRTLRLPPENPVCGA